MIFKLISLYVSLTLVQFCKAELRHVFVTVTDGEHSPMNHEGGHQILETTTEGTLTKNGIEMAYNTGQFLADTYGQALGWNTSDSKNYFKICSMKDKICELTALIIRAGLQNKEDDKYKKWTDAELESIYCSETDQYAKFFNKEECPAFYRELKKKTPEFTASIKRMQSKSLAAIVKKFGAQSIQNPKKLWLTMLTLESMKTDNATKMPVWATDQVIKDLKIFSKEFFKIAGSNDHLKRLSGGRRLSNILTEIVDIIVANFEYESPDSNGPKLSILTASQCVLASQIATFSTKDTTFRGQCILENVYPDRGAMHIIELHCVNEVWFIRILLKTSADDKLDVVKVHNNDEDCEVYEFVQLMAPYFLSEEELNQECKAIL